MHKINIYSKSDNELGRFLSNFTYSPFECEDGRFNSIEGYWYWLSCKDDHLRNLWGFEAKRYGRLVGGTDWLESEVFKTKIKKAIEIKITSNDKFLNTFIASNEDFDHYYVYGSKIVRPKEGKWIVDYITELRSTLQEQAKK